MLSELFPSYSVPSTNWQRNWLTTLQIDGNKPLNSNIPLAVVPPDPLKDIILQIEPNKTVKATIALETYSETDGHKTYQKKALFNSINATFTSSLLDPSLLDNIEIDKASSFPSDKRIRVLRNGSMFWAHVFQDDKTIRYVETLPAPEEGLNFYLQFPPKLTPSPQESPSTIFKKITFHTQRLYTSFHERLKAERYSFCHPEKLTRIRKVAFSALYLFTTVYLKIQSKITLLKIAHKVLTTMSPNVMIFAIFCASIGFMAGLYEGYLEGSSLSLNEPRYSLKDAAISQIKNHYRHFRNETYYAAHKTALSTFLFHTNKWVDKAIWRLFFKTMPKIERAVQKNLRGFLFFSSFEATCFSSQGGHLAGKWLGRVLGTQLAPVLKPLDMGYFTELPC